jgi:hypothetical protein
MVKLPALMIAGAAFGATGDIFKHIFTRAWFILALPVLAAFFLWTSFTSEYGDGSMSGGIALVLYIVFIIALIPLGICWTEKVVTKQDFKFNFDARIWPSLGYTLILLLIVYLPLILAFFVAFALVEDAAFSPALAMIIGFAFFFYWLSLVSRFSLAIPAIALRNPKTRLARSWSLTKGYQAKLFCLLFFPYLVISMGQRIIEHGLGSLITSQESMLVVALLIGLIQMYSIMFVSEIQARVFVFFHAPEKIDEYV